MYIFVALFVVLIASAVYFSTTAESVFVHDISPLIIESRRVFDMVVAVEWQFNFLRRRFDQLTFSNSFEHFVSAQESYQILRHHVASFDSSFVSHPALIKAIDSINAQLDLIEDRLMEFIQRVQIISKLATYHLPEYKLSTLVNITWNIDQLPLNERNTWNLPHGYSLSNSEIDLSKEIEYLNNVSRAVLTSKYFHSVTRDVVDSFAEIRRSTTITLLNVIQPFDTKLVHNLEDTVYLVVGLLVSTVLCCFFILISGLKQKLKASHVTQKISFPVMVNYTKQYVVSLSILFIVLSMFYFGSLIGFTQLRPLPRLIQDYGTRSALITRSTNDVVSALVDSDQRAHYLNNAKISLHSLTRLHHALVVNHIDNDFKQTELLLTVNLSRTLKLSTL
ncbi:hypothetical protein GEMRC1_001711 [Eukaryota sp. GEM-RC1]